MKTLVTFLFISMTISSFSQKKPLIERYEEVVKTATASLDEAMKGPDGVLFQVKTEIGLTGIYDFDITLHEKGEVATVFVNSREGGNIKMQNYLKDYLKDMKFGFKMPKGKDYKFNYVFNFN